MSTLIKKTLLACSLALAAAGICGAPSAFASQAKTHKSKTKAVVAATPEEAEPDITDTTTTEFNCELGNKVTIYNNDKDEQHIALRWKKRLHRLTRVGTSTGALRFENPHYGLIWIGIPSKGMLLDSKLNRQLANECKNADQSKPKPVVLDPAETLKS